jgi:hypothetical protein
MKEEESFVLTEILSSIPRLLVRYATPEEDIKTTWFI